MQIQEILGQTDTHSNDGIPRPHQFDESISNLRVLGSKSTNTFKIKSTFSEQTVQNLIRRRVHNKCRRLLLCVLNK